MNAVCHNQIGSFACACKMGYTGNGTHCADVNECGANMHGCDRNANCSNAKGSFACTCNSGFVGQYAICRTIINFFDVG